MLKTGPFLAPLFLQKSLPANKHVNLDIIMRHQGYQMSHSAKKNREWIDYFIALGAWAIAIFVAFTAFSIVLEWIFRK